LDDDGEPAEVTNALRVLKWLGCAIALLVAAFVALGMFLTDGPITFRETDRVSNPNKTIDAAVLWTSGGGVLGWSHTDVFVMAPGESHEDYYQRKGGSLSFNVNYPQKLHLSWLDDHKLRVRLICEEFPSKPETEHLTFHGEDLTVAIEYVDCDDVDDMKRN
jgi:hypothetical protein